MYQFTFILDNGTTDHILGDSFQKVLSNYFQWRGIDILGGLLLKNVQITGYPTEKTPYKVKTELLEQIITAFLVQNQQELAVTAEDIQQERCKDMKETCPEGSRDAEPITADDWCDDVPYPEFVKNDEYLSQCYRLTTLLQTFKAQLESQRGNNPFPIWPNEPLTRTALSPQRLQELHAQAIKAEVDIPEIFEKFIKAMNFGSFDIDVAMSGPYIGTSDHINPKYQTGFVIPAVDVLFGAKQSPKSGMTQEEKDLEFALKLAEGLSA